MSSVPTEEGVFRLSSTEPKAPPATEPKDPTIVNVNNNTMVNNNIPANPSATCPEAQRQSKENSGEMWVDHSLKWFVELIAGVLGSVLVLMAILKMCSSCLKEGGLSPQNIDPRVAPAGNGGGDVPDPAVLAEQLRRWSKWRRCCSDVELIGSFKCVLVLSNTN